MSAPPAFLTEPAKGLLVDGERQPAVSGRTFPSIDPSTGRAIASLAEGGAPDVDLAVASARAALAGPWRRFTPVDRQNALLRLADLVQAELPELLLIDSWDMGAPVSRAAAKPVAAASPVETLRYFAGWCTKIAGATTANSAAVGYLSYTRREPVGVVAAVIPWNSPLLAVSWKLGPALAAGCAVVLKPAEQASLVALRVGELALSAGFPPGVVNVVTGYGESAGAALAAHPDVDKIAFTGSVETGRAVVRAATGNLKRVSLELGGKSPSIVFADADLTAAVPSAAMSVFGNTGQTCIAGSRLFVQRSVHDEFVERLGAFGDALRVGVSTDPATQIGPLVSDEHLARVTSYVRQGADGGAELRTGGSRLTDGPLQHGYFVAPTVFAGVTDDMTIAREEIFGPVACVLPFDDLDEVAERANDTDFGLAAGVWTRDLATSHALVDRLEAGVVWVNGYGLQDPSVPFGGIKQSGWGKELSADALESYLTTKSVWIRTQA
jgi:aldehyde dehydrogenase (NAD+)